MNFLLLILNLFLLLFLISISNGYNLDQSNVGNLKNYLYYNVEVAKRDINRFNDILDRIKRAKKKTTTTERPQDLESLDDRKHQETTKATEKKSNKKNESKGGKKKKNKTNNNNDSNQNLESLNSGEFQDLELGKGDFSNISSPGEGTGGNTSNKTIKKSKKKDKGSQKHKKNTSTVPTNSFESGGKQKASNTKQITFLLDTNTEINGSSEL
uniref:Uncharacterized protein n=1 Tax=Strongyloides papillosus TaxID=174720 RepID=A0A0N5BDS8_STREA